MKKWLAVVAAVGLIVAGSASGEESTWDAFKGHLSNNWDQSKRAWFDGDWSLYFSGYTWHAPYAYSSTNRSDQNDLAWGGGIGRYVYDEKGNYHGLYVMAFSDSHYKPQYNFGYNWQTYWGDGNLKAGLGYTVFFFMRSDIGNYWPIPAILPLASVRYSKLEVMGTFVPGFGGGNGNVGYFFGRYNF